MNIHQKLVEVRKSIDGFTKDSKSYGYSYVSGTQVLSKIQDKMNEHGVLLIPSIITQDFEKHEYVNNKGKSCLDFLVYGQMTYKWVNAEKPEDFIEVPFFYTGAQDDISKAFGSGLTYSERYFIIKFFNLPTDADDPDARDTSGNSANNNNSQPRTSGSSPSPKQLETIHKNVSRIAAAQRKDPSSVYFESLDAAGITRKADNELTGTEASKLVGYLFTVK